MEIGIKNGMFFESVNQLAKIFDTEKLKNGDTDIIVFVELNEVIYSLHFTTDSDFPDGSPYWISSVDNNNDSKVEVSLISQTKSFQTFDEMLDFELIEGNKLKDLLNNKKLLFCGWDLFWKISKLRNWIFFD